MTTPSGPGLSVVVPVKNGASWIGRALASAHEFAPGATVIVVDDGSTDETADVVARDFPSVLVMTPSGTGVSTSRNAGLRAAVTEWVTFLDADDQLVTDLSHDLRLLSGDVDALIAGGTSIDRFGRTRWKWMPPRPWVWDRETLGRFLPGQVVFRRKFLVGLGGYDERLRFGENTELGLRMMAAGGRVEPRPVVACERLHRYRYRPYAESRASDARIVLHAHPTLERDLPALSADYHRIVGVDAARRGDFRTSRRHLLYAHSRQPGSWSRMRVLLTLVPGLRTRIWRPNPPAAKVAIVCPGANAIHRGYESYAKGLASALQGSEGLEVEMVGGGQPQAPWERRLPRLPSGSPLARLLARRLGIAPRSVEQYAFGLTYLATTLWSPPHVVIVSERPLANLLALTRRLGRGRWSIVFHNGGSATPPFDRFDLVQQVSPLMYEEALARGEPIERHVLVPEGLDLVSAPTKSSAEDERPTVISVGLIDKQIKGMDRLVRAVASLDPQPILEVLGEESSESDEVRHLAERLLEPGTYRFETTPPQEVAHRLAAAHCFALASLREGFGRAYVEAQVAGLPVVADDNPHTRWLLGDGEYLIDASDVASLAAGIRAALSESGPQAADRRTIAISRFDWSALRQDYVELILSSSPRLQV